MMSKEYHSSLIVVIKKPSEHEECIRLYEERVKQLLELRMLEVLTPYSVTEGITRAKQILSDSIHKNLFGKHYG